MTTESAGQLSDPDLLAATVRIAESCRSSTAELIALLAEIDIRKLYRGLGYSSLFTYCTQALHLSEPATYSRITAARAARRLPVIFRLLSDGDVTLTTITLLAPHLTAENHEGLLAAARHMGKRDVERLVASLDPQPDVASSVRRLPAPQHVELATPVAAPTPLLEEARVPAPNAAMLARSESTLQLTVPRSRPIVVPLAPERYLVKITIGRDAHAKLERARDLLRHSIPNGDSAAIVERALTVLLEQLERTKYAKARRPRAGGSTVAKERRVPAAVKRVVLARDEGRCAFIGTNGRCAETGFVEFHHVVPFAAGGLTSAENLELRCRSHNAYEAECWFQERDTRTTAAGPGS